MSTVYIIGTIAALLVLLVSYVFIVQTMDNNRKKHQRLLSTHKSRQRSLQSMLSSFPTNFLSKELNSLVYECLIDSTEQLAKIEPKETRYQDELTTYVSQLDTIKRQANTKATVQIQDINQANEARRNLQGLYKFVGRLQERGKVDKTNANLYRQQLKDLVLKLSVDTYITSGQQAQGAGKARLALHFFNLALKLLQKDTQSEAHIQQAQELSTQIKALEEELALTPESSQEDHSGALNEEWDKLDDKSSELWKKKNVYD